jgi:tRNA pseudouridine38-40 synthase
VEEPLDIDKMRQAAVYLTGRHDFKSFCKGPQKKKSTVRTVDKIEIRRQKGYITFSYHGDGFLRNMVRILTGTLVEVGRGNMTPEQVQAALAACERTEAGPTAPAQGLCLMEVDYQ